MSNIHVWLRYADQGNGQFAPTPGVYHTLAQGNGDGTFRAAASYTVGDGPDAVTTGDFNADGVLDLAVVNSASDDVSVLLHE